jgi:hypothetical protein
VPSRQSGFAASPMTARRRSLPAMQDGSATPRDAEGMQGTERRARKSDESECVIENGRTRTQQVSTASEAMVAVSRKNHFVSRFSPPRWIHRKGQLPI